MVRFVTAGIWITRRCNFRCSYCNVPKTDSKELKLSEWIKAVEIIKNLGIKKVVLLGGEVTLYSDLVPFVDYIINKANLECSLTTNSFNNYSIIKKLIAVGMKNISVSIDSLDSADSISPIKCKSGLELINRLEEDKLKELINLRCYVVVNKSNINKLENFIMSMTKRKIKVYLIPYHWGNKGLFEHRKNQKVNAFSTKKDVETFNEVMDRVISLKKAGFFIDNSEEYLRTTKKNIRKLDWKCDGISELRIDSDGKMMCCCDKKGDVNFHFSIFDLDSGEKLQEFLNMRANDSSICKGCLWPSSFENERMKKEGMIVK